jgi:hypothetical protein
MSKISETHGERILEIDASGPLIATERDANDLIGETFGQDVGWVVLPVERLDPSFFNLRTGLAGAVAQKFVNYRLKLAIVGDIAGHVAASKALHDFVYEANNGKHLWFVSDHAAFFAKLEKK